MMKLTSGGGPPPHGLPPQFYCPGPSRPALMLLWPRSQPPSLLTFALLPSFLKHPPPGPLTATAYFLNSDLSPPEGMRSQIQPHPQYLLKKEPEHTQAEPRDSEALTPTQPQTDRHEDTHPRSETKPGPTPAPARPHTRDRPTAAVGHARQTPAPRCQPLGFLLRKNTLLQRRLLTGLFFQSGWINCFCAKINTSELH